MPKKGAKKSSGGQKTGIEFCLLCGQPEGNSRELGEFYTHTDISAHYFCLLFSSGLVQQGEDEEGILGFLPKDIRREAARACRLRCSFCKTTGATIGCVKPRCRAAFHFPCGLAHGVLNQFYDNFRSYCCEHRPQQQQPMTDRLAFVGTAKSMCSICMCPVDARASETTLRSPCCKNSWFHKECIQNQAHSSGMHFFKCPLCNNKDAFQNEMLKYGIYIPDRDASWETEPQAYQELLERHSRCDLTTCICPSGRDHKEPKHKLWDVVLCDTCGSSGAHLKCVNLASAMDEYDCEECLAIMGSSPVIRCKKSKRRTKGERRRKKQELQKQVELLSDKVAGNYDSPGDNVESASATKPFSATKSESTTKSSTATKPASETKSTAALSAVGSARMACSGSTPSTNSQKCKKLKDNVSVKRAWEQTVDHVSRSSRLRPRLEHDLMEKESDNHVTSSRRSLQLKRQISDLSEVCSTVNLQNLPTSLKKLYDCDIFTGANLGNKLKKQFSDKNGRNPEFRCSLRRRRSSTTPSTTVTLAVGKENGSDNNVGQKNSADGSLACDSTASDVERMSSNSEVIVLSSDEDTDTSATTSSDSSSDSTGSSSCSTAASSSSSSSDLQEISLRMEMESIHGPKRSLPLNKCSSPPTPSSTRKSSLIATTHRRSSAACRSLITSIPFPEVEQARDCDNTGDSDLQMSSLFKSTQEKKEFVESFSGLIHGNMSDWEDEETICVDSDCDEDMWTLVGSSKPFSSPNNNATNVAADSSTDMDMPCLFPVDEMSPVKFQNNKLPDLTIASPMAPLTRHYLPMDTFVVNSKDSKVNESQNNVSDAVTSEDSCHKETAEKLDIRSRISLPFGTDSATCQPGISDSNNQGSEKQNATECNNLAFTVVNDAVNDAIQGESKTKQTARVSSPKDSICIDNVPSSSSGQDRVSFAQSHSTSRSTKSANCSTKQCAFSPRRFYRKMSPPQKTPNDYWGQQCSKWMCPNSKYARCPENTRSYNPNPILQKTGQAPALLPTPQTWPIQPPQPAYNHQLNHGCISPLQEQWRPIMSTTSPVSGPSMHSALGSPYAEWRSSLINSNYIPSWDHHRRNSMAQSSQIMDFWRTGQIYPNNPRNNYNQ